MPLRTVAIPRPGTVAIPRPGFGTSDRAARAARAALARLLAHVVEGRVRAAVGHSRLGGVRVGAVARGAAVRRAVVRQRHVRFITTVHHVLLRREIARMFLQQRAAH